MNSVHLARRGDVDEGGVLVVVVLVRGSVRPLRRGEGLSDPWRKIDIDIYTGVDAQRAGEIDPNEEGQPRRGSSRDEDQEEY